MAIRFDADNEDIDFGTSSNLDDLATFTFAVWYYPTTIDTAYRNIISKYDEPGGLASGWSITATDQWDGSTPNTLMCYTGCTGADQVAYGPDNMLTVDAWSFIAGYRPAIGTVPSLYHGSLTSLVGNVVEQDTNGGGGAFRSNAGFKLYASASEVAAGNARGSIAFAAIWSGQVTLAQLQIVQFRPIYALAIPNCEFCCLPGLHGGTTVVDLSGNGNNGTVANADLSPTHIPLGPPFGFDAAAPYVVPPAIVPTPYFYIQSCLKKSPYALAVAAFINTARRNPKMFRREFFNLSNWVLGDKR